MSRFGPSGAKIKSPTITGGHSDRSPTPFLSLKEQECLAFCATTGKRPRRGISKGIKGSFYVSTLVLNEAFPNEYRKLRDSLIIKGYLEIVSPAKNPSFRKNDGVCMGMRLTLRGQRVKSLRNGKALRRLAERVGKKRRSPNEDDVPRRWTTVVCIDGTPLAIPHKSVKGVWYPMLSVSNLEFNEATGKKLRYYDVKSAFPTALVRILRRNQKRRVPTPSPASSPGILNEGILAYLLSVPKHLKARTLTAIYRSSSSKDDLDPRVREVAQLSKALRQQMGWSKADLYWALAHEVVVPFQQALFEMGAMVLARVDGAFVHPWVDLDCVNRRMKELAGPEFEVKEKVI